MVTTTSTGAGNWNDAGKWNNGIPGTGVNVSIGHTMTLPSSYTATCANISFTAGGLLFDCTGGVAELSPDGETYLDLTNGNISATGTATTRRATFTKANGFNCTLLGSGTFTWGSGAATHDWEFNAWDLVYNVSVTIEANIRFNTDAGISSGLLTINHVDTIVAFISSGNYFTDVTCTSGLLSFAGNTSDVEVSGNWDTEFGDVVNNAETIIMWGTTKTIDATGTDFYNLTISGSIEAQTDFTIGNDMVITGTLTHGAADLVSVGEWKIDGGTHTFSGALTVGSFTIASGACTLAAVSTTISCGGNFMASGGTWINNYGHVIQTGDGTMRFSVTSRWLDKVTISDGVACVMTGHNTQTNQIVTGDGGSVSTDGPMRSFYSSITSGTYHTAGSMVVNNTNVRFQLGIKGNNIIINSADVQYYNLVIWTNTPASYTALAGGNIIVDDVAEFNGYPGYTTTVDMAGFNLTSSGTLSIGNLTRKVVVDLGNGTHPCNIIISANTGESGSEINCTGGPTVTCVNYTGQYLNLNSTGATTSFTFSSTCNFTNGTLNAGTSVIALSGGAIFTTAAKTFYDVVYTGTSGTRTQSGNLICNSFTMNGSGGTYAQGAATMSITAAWTISAGTQTFSGTIACGSMAMTNGTCTPAAVGTTITCSGTWNVSGSSTWTDNRGALTIDATGDFAHDFSSNRLATWTQSGGITTTLTDHVRIETSVTASGTGTINGSGMTISIGTATGTLFTHNGVTIGSGLTIELSTGNAAVVIDGGTYHHLVLTQVAGTSRTATVTGGNITLNGNLTLQVDNGLSGVTFTLKLNDGVDRNLSVTGTTLFGSGGAANVSKLDLQAGAHAFTGAMTISNGAESGILDCTAAPTVNTGDITLGSNGTIDHTAAGTLFTASGNVNLSAGAWITGTEELVMTGATPTLTTGANSKTFYNLTTSAVTTLTVTGDLTLASGGTWTQSTCNAAISGNYIISGGTHIFSGTLAMGSFVMTTGTCTPAAAGTSITCSGTWNVSGSSAWTDNRGALIQAGTGDFVHNSNGGSAGEALGSYSTSGAITATLTARVFVTGSFSVAAGGTVDTATFNLNVGGVTTINGTGELKTAANAAGSTWTLQDNVTVSGAMTCRVSGTGDMNIMMTVGKSITCTGTMTLEGTAAFQVAIKWASANGGNDIRPSSGTLVWDYVNIDYSNTIECNNVSDIDIEQVVMTNVGGNGFYFFTTASTITKFDNVSITGTDVAIRNDVASTKFTLTNCTLNCSGFDVNVNGNGAIIEFIDTTFNNIGGSGVRISNSTAGVILDGTVADNDDCHVWGTVTLSDFTVANINTTTITVHDDDNAATNNATYTVDFDWSLFSCVIEDNSTLVVDADVKVTPGTYGPMSTVNFISGDTGNKSTGTLAISENIDWGGALIHSLKISGGMPMRNAYFGHNVRGGPIRRGVSRTVQDRGPLVAQV